MNEAQQDQLNASPSITEAQFKEIQSDVLTSWPTARHLPKDFQSLSVIEHSENLITTNPVPNTASRREEFRTFLSSKIESLLGQNVARSVYEQLATNHSLPTAQHTTVLSPNTLNPTMTMSLAYANSSGPARKNIILLACSGISFNNHWYPRGHLFHSYVNDRIVEHQLNFFGRSMDADPVITAKGYNDQAKKNMTKTLLHLRSEKLIKKRELNAITEILETIYFSQEVLNQSKFIDQLTIANFNAWRKIFEGTNVTMPNLVFLAQEKIAADLIKNFHIEEKTILHEFIFNQEWHNLIYKYFEGIMCAFSVEKSYGTFLFWYTPKGTTDRIQLFAKDGVLTSLDEKVKIPLTPESIYQALLDEDITPGVMLTFVILGLYYGFALTGGLDQPTYLVQTKEAYLLILRDLGLEEEIKNCEPIIANDIILTRPTIAFLDDPNGERSPASALDLLVHKEPESWERLIEASKKVTFEELLYRLYPELYRDYCNHPKNDEILKITEQQIEKFTGIDKKIPAWAILE